MEETLLFIDEYQVWIFILLGVAAVIYARNALRGYGELRRALFGLEREQAIARLKQAGAMLALVAAGAATVFIITTFVTPAIPASSLPTAIPTGSLLTSPQGADLAAGGPIATATAIPEGGIDSSGCLNPDATLTEPQAGAVLSGIVSIRGTASIPNFGFYKLEYRSTAAGSAWRAISAGDEPRVDEELGIWDTTLVLPGDYAFRLVVADTAGNAPMPCVIPVRVAPAP
jgi:hypothetical protein